MPRVSYNIRMNKNNGLPISSTDLSNRYFLGIPIVDSSGNVMTDQSIEFAIRYAVTQMEGFLNLKFSKQIIEETQQFFRDDYANWGYTPTTYPAVKAHQLTGSLGDIRQVEFPVDWISTKRTNDGVGYHRRINIVPTQGSVLGSTVIFSSASPSLVGYYGRREVPDYWNIIYCTGFDKVPEDILDAIGKIASINIFHLLGDIILAPGIAGSSISIDGLNQSIQTTQSAENSGYSGRIRGYLQDLKSSLPMLKDKYDGFELTVL